MTQAQIALVKNTWKLFRDVDPVVVGDVFYCKLFLDFPQTKQMFHTAPAVQSRKLIEMINIIISRLDRQDELTEDIKQLAIRHVGYGAKPSHYRFFGESLMWTLQQGLGKDWTDEVENAWRACYAMLSETMIEVAY
ncbi:MAG: hemoglobin [Bacteroidetes bacterium]|nr:MAG: hemoglobin [Bacteroidota bacterium]